MISGTKEFSVSIFLLVWSKFIFLTVTFYLDSFLVKAIRTFLYVSFGSIVPWQLYISFELISSLQASLIFLLLISSAQDINKGPKNKPSILGTVSLNLADYALTAGETIEIILPLSVPGGAPEPAPSLHVSIHVK